MTVIVRQSYRNLFILSLLIVLFLSPIPTHTLLWKEAANSAHVVLFIFIVFLLNGILNSDAGVQRSPRKFLIILLVSIILALCIEGLQMFVQREASLADVVRDMFGITAGLFLVAGLEAKKKSLMLLATAFLLIGVSPLLYLSWHYVERNNAFPVLVEFNRAWSTSFVKYQGVETKGVSLSSGEDALHVLQFNQARYSGFAMIEPVADWTNFDKLRFLVKSKHQATESLNLRIHDEGHNQNFNDRFNIRLEIIPGLNDFSIKLKDIAHGPVTRKIKLDAIAGLILFSSRLQVSKQFEISNIYLE